ncbi:MAG TPA: hypothetical protein PK867_23970 [Pirellulales bacterium]|nr:hypothetical protein [Pirellulales bacterium]
MTQHEQVINQMLVGGAKQKIRPSRAAEAIALIDRWLNDESDYDEKTWPELKAALDRDRPSDRKLFDE